MRAIVILLNLLMLATMGRAQKVVYKELVNGTINYSPELFHISDIVDDRKDKESAGEVDGGRFDLRNGVEKSFTELISKAMPEAKKGNAVSLHVTGLDCAIKRNGRMSDVTVSMSVVFYFEDNKLLEFTGHGNARTAGDPMATVTEMICKSLKGDFEKFDHWWAENRGRVPTETAVKLQVTVSRTPQKTGIIIYSRERPLRVSDFEGEPGGNPDEAAATVSGIGMSYKVETQNSQLLISVTIYPDFEIGSSWFRNTDQQVRVLGHEQTHFDITALYACRLAAQLSAARLTRQNYAAVIDDIQRKNSEASNAEEAAYDAATMHGTIADMQAEWSARLKQEIAACGCY